MSDERVIAETIKWSTYRQVIETGVGPGPGRVVSDEWMLMPINIVARRIAAALAAEKEREGEP